MRQDRPTPSEESIEIDTRYAAERWRYICPNGHIDWEPTAEGFVCAACTELHATDGAFAMLRDRRSGERIPRDRVQVRNTAVAAAYEVEEAQTEPE